MREDGKGWETRGKREEGRKAMMSSAIREFSSFVSTSLQHRLRSIAYILDLPRRLSPPSAARETKKEASFFQAFSVRPPFPSSFRFGLEVHRAQTHLLGGFEIETEDRLSREVDLDMMAFGLEKKEVGGESSWWLKRRKTALDFFADDSRRGELTVRTKASFKSNRSRF